MDSQSLARKKQDQETISDYGKTGRSESHVFCFSTSTK